MTHRDSFDRSAAPCSFMVAVALLALLAFGAFVIDYGVMWVEPRPGQTSADAGALAGAIALAFDSPTDFAGAKTKAQAVAQRERRLGAGAGRRS